MPAQGHATSLGEISTDLFGIAMPIRGPSGALVASVNLAGPIFRLGNRMPRLLQAARRAAEAISAQVHQAGDALVVEPRAPAAQDG